MIVRSGDIQVTQTRVYAGFKVFEKNCIDFKEKISYSPGRNLGIAASFLILIRFSRWYESSCVPLSLQFSYYHREAGILR